MGNSPPTPGLMNLPSNPNIINPNSSKTFWNKLLNKKQKGLLNNNDHNPTGYLGGIPSIVRFYFFSPGANQSYWMNRNLTTWYHHEDGQLLAVAPTDCNTDSMDGACRQSMAGRGLCGGFQDCSNSFDTQQWDRLYFQIGKSSCGTSCTWTDCGEDVVIQCATFDPTILDPVQTLLKSVRQPIPNLNIFQVTLDLTYLTTSTQYDSIQNLFINSSLVNSMDVGLYKPPSVSKYIKVYNTAALQMVKNYIGYYLTSPPSNLLLSINYLPVYFIVDSDTSICPYAVNQTYGMGTFPSSNTSTSSMNNDFNLSSNDRPIYQWITNIIQKSGFSLQWTTFNPTSLTLVGVAPVNGYFYIVSPQVQYLADFWFNHSNRFGFGAGNQGGYFPENTKLDHTTGLRAQPVTYSQSCVFMTFYDISQFQNNPARVKAFKDFFLTQQASCGLGSGSGLSNPITNNIGDPAYLNWNKHIYYNYVLPAVCYGIDNVTTDCPYITNYGDGSSTRKQGTTCSYLVSSAIPDCTTYLVQNLAQQQPFANLTRTASQITTKLNPVCNNNPSLLECQCYNRSNSTAYTQMTNAITSSFPNFQGQASCWYTPCQGVDPNILVPSDMADAKSTTCSTSCSTILQVANRPSNTATFSQNNLVQTCIQTTTPPPKSPSPSSQSTPSPRSSFSFTSTSLSPSVLSSPKFSPLLNTNGINNTNNNNNTTSSIIWSVVIILMILLTLYVTYQRWK